MICVEVDSSMIEFGLLILLCDAFEELLNVYVILNELYSKSYKYR